MTCFIGSLSSKKTLKFLKKSSRRGVFQLFLTSSFARDSLKENQGARLSLKSKKKPILLSQRPSQLMGKLKRPKFKKIQRSQNSMSRSIVSKLKIPCLSKQSLQKWVEVHSVLNRGASIEDQFLESKSKWDCKIETF